MTTQRTLTPKQAERMRLRGGTLRPDDLNGWEWDRTRKRIRERDGYCCKACGRAERVGKIDHIKPLCSSGSNDDDNLQLLCHDCHVDKTNRDNGHRVKRRINHNGEPDGWK